MNLTLKILKKIKDNVDYLKLKSLTTDENERQYNFGLALKKKILQDL